MLKSLQSQETILNDNLEAELKENINELIFREESLWKQKSRISWLNTADLNTKFFHASTIIRHRRNTVDCSEIGRNHWTSNHSIIISKIQEHFQQIFTTSNLPTPDNLASLFPSKISDRENDFLCSIPTEEEIALIVHQLPSSKVPGPDGFTWLFYKTYWDVIKKKESITVIQNFFLN